MSADKCIQIKSHHIFPKKKVKHHRIANENVLSGLWLSQIALISPFTFSLDLSDYGSSLSTHVVKRVVMASATEISCT